MASSDRPVRLHRHPISGHCHRVELLLSLLGLPHELVEVDLMKGAQKAPAFLAKSPFGQVPVLEDGDVVLSDSNAILVYLALRYDPERRWLPEDPASAARVQRFLSMAAGELASGPATARVLTLFRKTEGAARAREIAAKLFAVLEAELARQRFLVGDAPTLADVALYAYTARAPEGHVSLDAYPNIRAWLERVESLPRFVSMMSTPVPET